MGHDAKIIWSIFRRRGSEGASYEEAPLEGLLSLTLHRIQPGAEGDSHAHVGKEQVYYFTAGRGQMRIDGHLYDVREGDANDLPWEDDTFDAVSIANAMHLIEEPMPLLREIQHRPIR